MYKRQSRAKKLGVLEGGTTPVKYTYFQGGDQVIDLTYTLPTAFPVTNPGLLKSTIAGVMSWDETAYVTGTPWTGMGYLTSVTAHNLLSATHGDTTAGSVVRGDLVTGQGTTAKWARLAFPGTPTGKILQATATDIGWSANPLSIGASASVSGSNTGDQSLSGLVPYTGANADVNLGVYKLKFTNGSYLQEIFDGIGYDMRIYSRTGYSFGYANGNNNGGYSQDSFGLSFYKSFITGLETGATLTHIFEGGAVTGDENALLYIGSGGIAVGTPDGNALFNGRSMGVNQVGNLWTAVSDVVTSTDASEHSFAVGQGCKLINAGGDIQEFTVTEILSTTSFRVDTVPIYVFTNSSLFTDFDLANIRTALIM